MSMITFPSLSSELLWQPNELGIGLKEIANLTSVQAGAVLMPLAMI